MVYLESCRVDIQHSVATITLIPPRKLSGGTSDLHWELGEVFSSLRSDADSRVVVLTGEEGEFYCPPAGAWWTPETCRYLVEPEAAWKTFTGVIRTHQAMADLEKPIIAKVGGDAVGFGSSLAFASDLIVAAHDARFVDVHLAMGQFESSGPPFPMVPGDGGVAVVPLQMGLARAKEYLMLSRPMTGDELAKLGAINYALPSGDLDGKVDSLIEEFMRQPAQVVGWTKRAINRHVSASLARSLDVSAAYQMVSLLQAEKRGWDLGGGKQTEA